MLSVTTLGSIVLRAAGLARDQNFLNAIQIIKHPTRDQRKKTKQALELYSATKSPISSAHYLLETGS